MMGKMEKGENS